MLRVKVSDLNYEYHPDAYFERKMAASGWDIEKNEAPFDYFTVHIASLGKLNKVVSVDHIAECFLESGGSIVREKLIIPGVAALITCKDDSGHIFSFIEDAM